MHAMFHKNKHSYLANCCRAHPLEKKCSLAHCHLRWFINRLEILIVRNTHGKCVIITQNLKSHGSSVSACCSVILSVPMAK